MAYTPINWQTGDTITAEKLNKMDNGWGYESTQLFSETVTTIDDEGVGYGSLAYSSVIDAATITVTFDGTDYTCSNSGSGQYGAPWSDTSWSYDFSTYPFNITSSGEFGNSIATETAGTHTVAVIAQGIETSYRFDAAVNKAVVKDSAFEVISGTTTFQEACDAFKDGKHVYVVDNSSSGKTYHQPVILVNENTFEMKFITTMASDTSLGLSSLSASSADGALE